MKPLTKACPQPPGDPTGGGLEWALPPLCHPVVSAAGQLPVALPAGPLPQHAGQNQLHQPGPAPPAGGLQPLQGPGRRPHRVCLPQGHRALQARWGQQDSNKTWCHELYIPKWTWYKQKLPHKATQKIIKTHSDLWRYSGFHYILFSCCFRLLWLFSGAPLWTNDFHSRLSHVKSDPQSYFLIICVALLLLHRDSGSERSRAGREPAGPVPGDAGTTHPLTLPQPTSQVTACCFIIWPTRIESHVCLYFMFIYFFIASCACQQVWKAASSSSLSAFCQFRANRAAVLSPDHWKHANGEAVVWYVQKLRPLPRNPCSFFSSGDRCFASYFYQRFRVLLLCLFFKGHFIIVVSTSSHSENEKSNSVLIVMLAINLDLFLQ